MREGCALGYPHLLGHVLAQPKKIIHLFLGWLLQVVPLLLLAFQVGVRGTLYVCQLNDPLLDADLLLACHPSKIK